MGWKLRRPSQYRRTGPVPSSEAWRPCSKRTFSRPEKVKARLASRVPHAPTQVQLERPDGRPGGKPAAGSPSPASAARVSQPGEQQAEEHHSRPSFKSLQRLLPSPAASASPALSVRSGRRAHSSSLWLRRNSSAASFRPSANSWYSRMISGRKDAHDHRQRNSRHQQNQNQGNGSPRDSPVNAAIARHQTADTPLPGRPSAYARAPVMNPFRLPAAGIQNGRRH